MALDPKRRAGWILDLLLQGFCREFNFLSLPVTERNYNNLAAILDEAIATTDPANAESNLSPDRTIN